MEYEKFTIAVWVWMAIGLLVFIYLQRVRAPYGRHTRPGWGRTIDNRMGWFLMEVVVLLVFGWFLLTGPVKWEGLLCIMPALFVLHYIHRSIIFPLQIRTSGKRMPLAIVLSAVGFNLVNGFFLGYYFGNIADYDADWIWNPRFGIGLALFLIGAWINLRSDYYLIKLRKPGDTGYRIPDGGLFRYVSCPNHLGEILEWFGFAVMTWSLPGLAFAWWTFANLVPRSVAHHQWYQSKFPDYPSGRKAVIPGVW
jgi:3-oxo-5-alpha-steroid 4-dehydrogenase 1